MDSEVTAESKCMHWKGTYRSFNSGNLCKNSFNYHHFLAIHLCLKTSKGDYYSFKQSILLFKSSHYKEILPNVQSESPFFNYRLLVGVLESSSIEIRCPSSSYCFSELNQWDINIPFVGKEAYLCQ